MAGGDYQLVPVPITPGMREDIHRNAAAPPGTLRYASNVRWGAMGAAERRNGTTRIATTTTAGAAVASGYPIELMRSTRDATFLATAGCGYFLRAAENGWEWAGACSASEPHGGRALARDGAAAITSDMSATCAIDTAGYRFSAYSTTTGPSVTPTVHYTIEDPDGNVIRAGADLGTVRRVRAVAAGATIYICVQDTSTHVISVYSTTAGSTPAVVTATLVTLDAAVDSWDVSPWTSTHWVFASLDSSSTTVTVRRMSGGTSAATATQSTNMRATSRITIYGDTNHVWLGWSDNSVSNVARITCWNWTGAAFSSTFTSSTAFSWTVTTQTGSPPIIGKGPSATQVRVVGAIHHESGHSSPDLYVWQSKLVDTAGTYSLATTQYHANPLSKPFGPNGEFVWVDLRVKKTLTATDPPACIALARTSGDTVGLRGYYVIDLVAQYDPEGLAYPVTDWWAACPQGLDSRYTFPVRRLSFDGVETRIHYDFRVFELKGSNLNWRDSTLARNAVLVAGQPCMLSSGTPDTLYVGTYMSIGGVETGIHRSPVIRAATPSNGAGSLTSNTTYQYVAVYKWEDQNGDVHRSAPSAPVTVTMGASDDTVTLDIASIDWERKFVLDEGVMEVYRTEAGQTLLHNLVDMYNPSAAVGSTADYSIGYTDVTADTAIEDNAILYTQASQIANDMAPACRFIRSSETRVWAGGLWDPTLIQASKILVPGEPVQWSSLDTFKVLLPQACTGLAFQDGALLAFSSTSVYAIGTDGGPGNDGLQSFQDPRLVCPGIGTEQAASILETPIGVIFRSRRGFELIPRGLGNVQSLPGIETTLETYSTISSSTLHVDGRTTTAQFVARSSNGLAVVLVFDLDKQAWSIDTYPVDILQIGTTADGRLLLASENTAVSPAFLVEDPTVTTDDSVNFQLKLTFHDIYPFGVFKMGAVHSVFARADSQGACTMYVDVGVDGGTARSVQWTFSGASTFEAYKEQTPAVTQCRGTSVQLSAYDGDAAPGVALYGFGLRVADKDSTVLLNSAEKQ